MASSPSRNHGQQSNDHGKQILISTSAAGGQGEKQAGQPLQSDHAVNKLTSWPKGSSTNPPNMCSGLTSSRQRVIKEENALDPPQVPVYQLSLGFSKIPMPYPFTILEIEGIDFLGNFKLFSAFTNIERAVNCPFEDITLKHTKGDPNTKPLIFTKMVEELEIRLGISNKQMFLVNAGHLFDYKAQLVKIIHESCYEKFARYYGNHFKIHRSYGDVHVEALALKDALQLTKIYIKEILPKDANRIANKRKIDESLVDSDQGSGHSKKHRPSSDVRSERDGSPIPDANRHCAGGTHRDGGEQRGNNNHGTNYNQHENNNQRAASPERGVSANGQVTAPRLDRRSRRSNRRCAQTPPQYDGSNDTPIPNLGRNGRAQMPPQYDGSNDTPTPKLDRHGRAPIPDILASSRGKPMGKGTFQQLEKIREGLGNEWTAPNDDEDEDPSPWFKRPGREVTSQSSASATPAGNTIQFTPLAARTPDAPPSGNLSAFSSLVAKTPNTPASQAKPRWRIPFEGETPTMYQGWAPSDVSSPMTRSRESSVPPSVPDSNASRGYVHSARGSPEPDQGHGVASSEAGNRGSRPVSVTVSHSLSGFESPGTRRARSRSPSKSPSLYLSARGSPAPGLRSPSPPESLTSHTRSEARSSRTSSISGSQAFQSPAFSQVLSGSESLLPSVTGSRPYSLSRSLQSGRGNNKRRFAPAFAERLPKIDEYDPQKALKPDDTYRFLKEKEDAKLKGTWLTIDPSTRKRTLDPLFHAERHTAESNRSDLTRPNTASEGSIAQLSGLPPRSDTFDTSSGIADSDRASTVRAPSSVAGSEEFPSLANARWMRGSSSQGSISSPRPAPRLDPRFENPDLDVDESVRQRFVPISKILDETVAPRSAYEQRNAGIMTKKKAAPIKVIIGGKVAKELNLKADNRGEHQDRFGNYIGKNLGQMKKYLIEERAANIKQRDREMVLLTQEERRLAAMTPAERTIYELEKLAREPKEFWGAVNTDISATEDIPDVYVPKYTTWNLRGNWSRGRGGRGGRGNYQAGSSHGTYSQRSRTSSFAHGTQPSPRSVSYSDDTIPLDSGASTPFVEHPYASGSNSTPRNPRPPPPPSTFSRPSTATSAPPEPLDLYPLKDASSNASPPAISHADMPSYLQTVQASLSLPRIVHITLDKLVEYSPGAIAARLFGGSIQELQFFPHSRAALVVFAFPAEAAAFMQHIRAVCERGTAQEARALQIKAQWHAAPEYHAQEGVLKQLFAGASRALAIRGYPADKGVHEVSRELGLCWGVMFVRVSGSRVGRRRDAGVEIVLEFASVSEAWDVMMRVEEGGVEEGGGRGYEELEARWLKDPCDAPGKRSEACSCAGCLV